MYKSNIELIPSNSQNTVVDNTVEPRAYNAEPVNTTPRPRSKEMNFIIDKTNKILERIKMNEFLSYFLYFTNDMASEIPISGNMVSDVYYMNDENILKIFRSIPYTDFNAFHIYNDYVRDGIIEIIIGTYFYVYTAKPHLLSEINGLFNCEYLHDKIYSRDRVSKDKKEYSDYTVSYVVDDSMIEATKAMLVEIAEECIVSNTYTIVPEEEELHFSEDEIARDLDKFIHVYVSQIVDIFLKTYEFIAPGDSYNYFHTIIEMFFFTLLDMMNMVDSNGKWYYTDILSTIIRTDYDYTRESTIPSLFDYVQRELARVKGPSFYHMLESNNLNKR